MTRKKKRPPGGGGAGGVGVVSPLFPAALLEGPEGDMAAAEVVYEQIY